MTTIYGLEEANEFSRNAQAVAKEVLSVHAADVDAKGRFPEQSRAALSSAGFMGLCVPADFGGKGQGPRAFASVVEELAQCCASSAMIYVMHVTASQAIAASKHGEREQLLRDIAAGKHLTTLAFSESGSRSIFWVPMSKLSASGDGFSTSAKKSWVTSADHADSYVSTAGVVGAQSVLESTLYLVKRKSPGVKVKSAFDGLGLRGNNSCAVDLEDVKLKKSELLCEQGKGLDPILQVVLPWFSIGTAAMANGISRAAIAATTTHLTNAGFEHDGKKLRDLPNLRARLAQMSLRAEQSRALLGYTLGLLEKSELPPLPHPTMLRPKSPRNTKSANKRFIRKLLKSVS